MELVPMPNDHSIIGTKWIFRNKMDEHSNIVRNNARLVNKGIVKKKELIMRKLMPR